MVCFWVVDVRISSVYVVISSFTIDLYSLEGDVIIEYDSLRDIKLVHEMVLKKLDDMMIFDFP